MSWEVSAMKSGRSFCSIPIFRKNCARFWPLCGGFFLLLTVYVLRFADGGPGMTSSPAANFLDSVNGMMIAWLPLYGLMCGVLFLGYLFQTGSTQAYHSMPLRRGTLLGTAILSGLVFLLAPLALAAALAYLLIPGCTTEPLEWAAVLGIVSFYAFALSCLSAVLTGTRPGAVLVFVVFLIGAPSLEAMGKAAVLPLLRGLVYPGTVLRWLCPPIMLLELADVVEGHFALRLWPYLAAVAGGALALLGLAWFLYRRRKSEGAGDFVAARWLRPVIRYGLTFLGGLGLGELLSLLLGGEWKGELGATMVFLLTGVLVARLTAEMLLARSVRVFQARRLVSYGLCLALTGGALLAVDGDILGLETRIPAPEQISQATLSVGVYPTGAPVSDPEELREITELHRLVLEHQNGQKGKTCRAYFSYRLTGGETMIRQYRLIFSGQEMAQENGLYRKLSEFFHRPEQVLAGLVGPDATQEELRQQIVSCAVYDGRGEPVDLTGNLDSLQARELWDRAWQDICNGDLYLDDGYGMDGSFGEITLEFQLQERAGEVAPHASIYLELLSDSRNTMEYLTGLAQHETAGASER